MALLSEENVLPDMLQADFMDILQDGSDFDQVFCNDGLAQEVNFNQSSVPNDGSQYSLSSLEGFDPSFSPSGSSLDQNSPQSLTFSTSDYNGYVYQNSPSTSSIDSGVTSDPSYISESPQLSPASGSINYLDYVDPYGNVMSTTQQKEPAVQEISGQGQELLVKLINQQIQQALLQQQQVQLQQVQQQQQQNQQQTHQQQSQQQQQQQQRIQAVQAKQVSSLQDQLQSLTQPKQQNQQNLALMQAHLQQRYLRLSQQQQQQQQLQKSGEQQYEQLNRQDISNQSKNDSQLRKMLMQTKTNISNAISDTKGKISNFKFSKSTIKPNKRKGSPAPDGSPRLEKKSNQSIEPVSPVGLQYPDGIEGIMYQDSKLPLTQQLQTSNKCPSSEVLSLLEAGSPVEQVKNMCDLDSPVLSPDGNKNHMKTSLSRLNSQATHVTVPIKTTKAGAKRTRVEHVIIEKRYRMKITDSLNELKIMLNCVDEKKATKNAILQASIDEIKRLRKLNESLSKKNKKMRKLFEELKNIGIIPAGQTVSSSGSESSNKEQEAQRIDSVDEDMEPEVNQDHYASPFQRQSTRDAGKLITCFTIFMFLFMNPLAFFAAKPNDIVTDGHYKSRHLLSTSTSQEASPQYYLITNLINIVMSFFILMFIVLRGNPHSSKIEKNSKLTVCYTSQLRKAQMKINKHEYDDAKDFLRIALFVVGNSCPKTVYGQLASFLWKCCCHILYQLGVVTAMEAIGRAVFPKSISLADDREDREMTAKLSAEAYRKLHEIAVKDPESTYMETACYLMNYIYSAEVSGDHEVLCTAYATAVVHMKEKVMYPSLLQYYFTGCSHHVSLASQDDYAFAIDWIFETRGYEYFANGNWNVQKNSQFYLHSDDSDLDEPDLLQIVYAQFQDYLLSKALKRLVAPETFYPNEGKIELRQRAMSFLNTIGTGPLSEHLDNMSIYQQSLYGWWGAVLKHLMSVMKHVGCTGNESNEMTRLIELYENIDERHRHEMVDLMKHVISVYTGVQLLEHNFSTMLPSETHTAYTAIKEDIQTATQLIQRYYDNKKKLDKNHVETEEDEQIDNNELLLLFCCMLMQDSHYILWKTSCFKPTDDGQLNELMSENQIILAYAHKYRDMEEKVQQYDFQIQLMSGINASNLKHTMQRMQRVNLVCSKLNDLDCYLYENRQYPARVMET